MHDIVAEAPGDVQQDERAEEYVFGDLCLLCMNPCIAKSSYCSAECEALDAANTHEPLHSGLDSPVPPLVPAGGSSSCSSTPSSSQNSPLGDRPLIGHEEPSTLALPPSLTSKPPLHFNYRYSYGTSPKDGTSPPFGPSSAERSSKSSSATPEGPHSIVRTLTVFAGQPQGILASTAPPLTLPARRTSMVSPRLRPLGPSPHASPALRPLTTLSNISLQKSKLDSPTLTATSRSVGAAPDMSRRASVPLSTTFESDNEADDEANSSAFANYLFEKSRRSSEVQRRRAGTAAPSSSPVSRSTSIDASSAHGGPRRHLYGRATPSPAPTPGSDDQVEQSVQSRGRSRQRQEGSTVYRSVSPKVRSGSGQRDSSPQEGVFERGRRARRRVSQS